MSNGMTPKVGTASTSQQAQRHRNQLRRGSTPFHCRTGVARRLKAAITATKGKNMTETVKRRLPQNNKKISRKIIRAGCRRRYFIDSPTGLDGHQQKKVPCDRGRHRIVERKAATSRRTPNLSGRQAEWLPYIAAIV
jgi:hypothetical protein